MKGVLADAMFTVVILVMFYALDFSFENKVVLLLLLQLAALNSIRNNTKRKE